MRQRTQARLKDRVEEWYPKKLLAKKLGYKQPLSITKACKKMDNKQARKIQTNAITMADDLMDSVIEMCRK
jgi:hypothetical protein